jgi:MFS transporter, PAT family, beta-lactamase induction signal transducer AmpG
LLTHAFFAATQDVAIDAMAIRSVPARERGSLNGAMQVGMIGGRVMFSSGVLYLSAATRERIAVPMLLAVILGTLVLVVLMPPGSEAKRPAPVQRRRTRYLRVLLATPRFWRLVAFALIGGAGFEAAGSLSGSWLVDRGFESSGIATFRLIGAVLMAIGAWLGGRMADHRGARFVTQAWLVVLASLLAATALCDLAPASRVATMFYAITYFAIGAFTAGSYALFMQNANGPLAATVFSAFMGLTNACEAWAGRLGGAMQMASSYGASLLLLAALSLFALLLLPRRQRTGDDGL